MLKVQSSPIISDLFLNQALLIKVLFWILQIILWNKKERKIWDETLYWGDNKLVSDRKVSNTFISINLKIRTVLRDKLIFQKNT